MSEALRNSLEEDCLKPPLSELKLEPETETHLDLHTAVNKSDKIRQIVSEHSSAESQKTVEAILEQVTKLTTLDKLLLYLKLPNDRSNDIDPLRQPLNPLGSRSEIQQTIIWIKTHLYEDPQVSLPKHEVYDEYIVYCSTNSIKPLSTADFGKVMKQVYPQVRPRRLGTRGNSRYCYAGLRKRLKLDVPLTPDINSEGKKAEGGDTEEELNNAVSFLIREWVEKLLQVKFESLKDLAYHLLEKMYVGNRSVAAFTLLSSSSKYGINATIKTCLGSPSGGSGTPLPLQMQPGAPLQMGQEAKHSTATLQLQRKLVEREQKRKLTTDHQEMQQVNMGAKVGVRGKRSKIGPGGVIMDEGLDYDAYESSSEYDRKYCPPDEPPSEKPCDRYVGSGNGISDVNNHSQFHGHPPLPLAVNGAISSINEPRSFMEAEAEEVQPRDFSTNQYSERIDLGPTSPILLSRPNSSISIDKLPRKKQALAEVAASIAAAQNLDTSSFVVHPGGLGGMAGLIHNTNVANQSTHSLIKAGQKPKSKYKECDEGAWLGPAPPTATILDTPDAGAKAEVGEEWGGGPDQQTYDEPADLTTLGRVQQPWPEKQVLESGGSSSDPQEEELARYFSQTETEGDSKNDKLSQLRQLLEQKLKSPTLSCGSGAFKRTSLTSLTLREGKPVITSSQDQGFSFGGADQALNNQTLSNRRRVSFNPLIVSDPGALSVVTSVPVTTGQCPVPPSPGTRRRHFSFQPISPRQGSLPQSPPASPFISPRSTPVHMLRSRHNSASALPLHLLPGSSGRQQHPSGSGSDISRAATFGSASESSTPFISPQGTPIPFNRSRHNSAQGRLCPSQMRSRHSSGVPLTGYRYTTMPYSPMALNNLNNPFSPQPATPILCQVGDQPDPFNPLVPGVQFISPGDDPRSRHSSAGSDHAPRSAPLSPMIGGGTAPDPVRTRHQSAGNVPSTATTTIHYRPVAWQHQHTPDFNSEVSSLLGGDQTCRPQSVPLAQIFHHGGGYTGGPGQASQPPTPGGAGESQPSFSYPAQGIVTGQNQSHHSSYSNTPIPPDYNGTDDQEGQLGIDKFMTDELSVSEENQAPNAVKKSDDDDLGLALDALRDCDNEFSKFVQETVGSTSCTTTN